MINRTFITTSALAICFVFLTGCKDERPEGVLSEEQMTELLLEVYLGEGKISSLNIKRDSSLAVFEVYEQKLFERLNVDKAQYKKSLTYYYDNPEVLERIYEGVLDSLNIKDQKLKELESEAMKKKHGPEGKKDQEEEARKKAKD